MIISRDYILRIIIIPNKVYRSITAYNTFWVRIYTKNVWNSVILRRVKKNHSVIGARILYARYTCTRWVNTPWRHTNICEEIEIDRPAKRFKLLQTVRKVQFIFIRFKLLIATCSFGTLSSVCITKCRQVCLKRFHTQNPIGCSVNFRLQRIGDWIIAMRAQTHAISYAQSRMQIRFWAQFLSFVLLLCENDRKILYFSRLANQLAVVHRQCASCRL